MQSGNTLKGVTPAVPAPHACSMRIRTAPPLPAELPAHHTTPAPPQREAHLLQPGPWLVLRSPREVCHAHSVAVAQAGARERLDLLQHERLQAVGAPGRAGGGAHGGCQPPPSRFLVVVGAARPEEAVRRGSEQLWAGREPQAGLVARKRATSAAGERRKCVGA